MEQNHIKLTAKQQQTLDLIKDLVAKTGQAPTIQELADKLKLDSLRSVTQRLEALERKGFIKRDRFKQRSIVLIDINPMSPLGTITVPVIASAGCDAAEVYAQETYDEYLTVDKKKIGQKKDVVAIKAVGGSMIDAGVHNGDYVLVEVTENVGNGDRVVAVMGDMAVIKRLKKTRGAAILEPEAEGKGYSPIVLSEDSRIFGKVVSIIPGSGQPEDEVVFEYEKGYKKF